MLVCFAGLFGVGAWSTTAEEIDMAARRPIAGSGDLFDVDVAAAGCGVQPMFNKVDKTTESVPRKLLCQRLTVIPTAMGRGNRWRMPYDEVNDAITMC